MRLASGSSFLVELPAPRVDNFELSCFCLEVADRLEDDKLAAPGVARGKPESAANQAVPYVGGIGVIAGQSIEGIVTGARAFDLAIAVTEGADRIGQLSGSGNRGFPGVLGAWH